MSGTTHSQLIESLNPVSFWRLSELSGSIAVDESDVSSGVYKDGVTLGAVGAFEGDTAASFDGDDDRIEIPHDDAYLLDEGSLSVWFNSESVLGTSGLVSKDSRSKDTGGHFSMLVQHGVLRVRSQSVRQSKDLYSDSGSLSSDTWHYAVVTWGGSGISLYLDGELSASDPSWTTGLNVNLEPIVVGGLQWRSGNFVADFIESPWEGRIDELAIFDQTLNAGQVRSLYDASAGSVPENHPPVAVDDTASTRHDEPITIDDVLANDSDADGDAINVTDFERISLQGGEVTHNGAGSFNYTPPLNLEESDSFQYEIGDGNGGTDTARVNIVLIPPNNPPAAIDDSATTLEDTPVTISNVLQNDTDADGNTLRVASFDSSSNHGGAVVHNGDGVFSYTPPANFNSTDSFSYLIDDGSGGTDTATVSIVVTPVNDAPVARNDIASTDENASITIPNVMANDSDVDGDSISILSFDSVSVQGGTVRHDGDGTFTYTPRANFHSSDSFSYQISDGNGGTDRAIVEISVAAQNNPPVAVDDTASTSENTPITIANVLANDSDVDGDTIQITSFDSTSVQGGAVTHNGVGTFTYTPPLDSQSTDRFSYQISDGNGGTDVADVVINFAKASATSYSDRVLGLNPVSYWRLSESTGVTAIDEMGVSSGVYKGGVSIDAAGVLPGDSAASFDGVDDIIEIPHNDAYVLDEGSLGVWFNVDSVSGSWGLVSKDSRSKDTGGHLSLLAQHGALRVRSQSVFQSKDLITPNGALSSDTWHYAVLTWGNSGMSLYLDGNLSVSDPAWTTGLNLNLEPIVLGGLQWRSGNLVADVIENQLIGKIDELALFDQVLSATQIQALYATATGGVPQNSPPVAVDDSAAAQEGTTVTFSNVLANDFDVDGDALIITSFDSLSANGGSVTHNGDGIFTYTPPSDFSSTDSFQYQISDGNGGSDTGTVNISVIPTSDSGLSVFAGIDRTVSILPWQSISLDALISGATGTASANWSVVSGPGGVYFDDAFNTATDVVFEKAGNHILRVVVTDDLDSVVDEISIDVDRSTTRISALGDSITEADAQHASFRRPLWHQLQDEGFDVDFVGSSQANHNGPNPFSDFDVDHEGHWGWRADEIASNLNSWLQSYTPDVVLIHIGHNDLKVDSNLQNTLDDTAQIISQLRADNPNVAILLATLIPSLTSPRDVRIPLYNGLLPAFAEEMHIATSPVILVDQFAGFDPIAHTYDGIHPNATGEELMANRWFEGIVDLFEPSDMFGSNNAAAVRTTAVQAAIEQLYKETEDRFKQRDIHVDPDANERELRTSRKKIFAFR